MHAASPPAGPQRMRTRYTAVAIALHWAIAVLILSMIPMGWWMVRAIARPETQPLAYQLFQLHKSVGLAILALSLVRLLWRLAHPAPPLPKGMRKVERFGARATHVAFYGLMLALPLTGWIYVSSAWAIGIDRPLDVTTSLFGLAEVPHLPGLSGNRAAAFGAMGAHRAMAYGGLLLVLLHIGAALKHHVVDRDGVLSQMIPLLRSGRPEPEADPPRRAASGTGARAFGLAAVAALAGLGAWQGLPTPLAEPTAMSVAAQAEPPATPAATPPLPGRAAAWDIDRARSAIGFSGSHAGRAFAGRFEDWSGEIRFDPDDLAGSSAVVTVRTGSARTDDATRDGSLRNGEWMNAARFPEASFRSTGFRALGGGHFEAAGTLTLKSRSLPVTLPFALRIEGDRAIAEGRLELDRAALDLGMVSDPTAAWVSAVIGVEILVEATRSP